MDIKKYMKQDKLDMSATSVSEATLRLANSFIQRINPPVADPVRASTLSQNFRNLQPNSNVPLVGHVKQARDLVAEILAAFEREVLLYFQVMKLRSTFSVSFVTIIPSNIL